MRDPPSTYSAPTVPFDVLQPPTWDKHNESLGAFLLTTTKPQIFFMPVSFVAY